MRHTIFDTPIVNGCFRLLSHLGLKLFGWKLEGQRPNARKYVIIAAPHTSNWDFVLTIAFAFCFRMKIFWIIKKRLAALAPCSLLQGTMSQTWKKYRNFINI